MKQSFKILLLALPLLPACATNPVTGSQDLVLMSEKQEIQIGQQAAQQVMQQYSSYSDAELQNYVQYVGGKVAAKSHRPELKYQFTLLDSDEVNAFALPGGYIYITRGLLSYLNTEAQLAAVLGHEVGHVTARHAVRQQSASQLTGLGAAIGAAFIPGLGQAGHQLAGVLGEALLRGYGRDHELEADRLGAEYLARSNYDPDAMLQVIRVLKNQETFEFRLAKSEGREPRVYHGLFSTHPDNDTRLQEVVAAASQIAPVENPYVGREEFLQRNDGLIYGKSQHQGVVKGRDFYHGPLGFAVRFPPGWKINNMSDRVLAVSPGQNAMIQMTMARGDPKLEPREYMMQRMGLKQLGNERALTINGMKAYTATAPVESGDGKRLARMTIINFGNNIFVVAGLARAPGEQGQYDGSFLDTAESFRQLKGEEKKAYSHTQHIQLLRTTPGMTFDDLAKVSPLEQFPEQQLRLINGRYPQGPIKPGETLKIVK